MIGYWYRKCNWLERILAIITGFLLIMPETITDIVGLVLFIAMVSIQYMSRDKDEQKIVVA